MILTPEIALARQICFMLGEAEHALGIEAHGLPLDARLERVLAGAMERPQLISADAYAALYLLRRPAD
jgi:hypothetical protein